VLLSAKTLRHVLVIGADGVRFDLLGPEVTPVIWSFADCGFLRPVPVDETTPTWSGPCWAARRPPMSQLCRKILGSLSLRPSFAARICSAC
jgi:hypothetical protein